MANTDNISQSNLQDLFEALSSSNVEERLGTLDVISKLDNSSLVILKKLEDIALNDRSKKVQKSAVQALLIPAHRTLQKNAYSHVHVFARQQIVKQISIWIEEKIITEQQGDVLTQRYDFDSVKKDDKPDVVKRQIEPKPSKSFSEILLDPSTIQITLYLGAFFVIAAAFIFASIIEFLRIPILIFVTAVFLVAAIGLKKKILQASIVMFTIFSLMIPIDASVIANTLNLSRDARAPYWVFITTLLVVIWGGGTWYYNSRFFSVLASGASVWLVLSISDWISPPFPLTQILLGVLVLGQVGVVNRLIEWKDKAFATPVVGFIHVQQLILLLSTPFAISDIVQEGQGWWLAVGVTWLLSAVFYYVSYQTFTFGLFPYLTILSLLPVPWFVMGAVEPEAVTVFVITWIWGAVLVIGGEYVSKQEENKLKPFGLPAQIGAVLMFVSANLGGIIEDTTLGFILLLLTTLVYGGLTFTNPRALMWGITLINGLFTYLALYLIPPLDDLEVFPGFVFLWPTIAFLGGELFAKFKLKTEGFWHTWLKGFGIVSGLMSLLIILGSGYEDQLRASISLLILSLFLVLYALVYKEPEYAYFSTLGLEVSLVYYLIHIRQDLWMVPMMTVALVYYGVGYWLDRQNEENGWGKMLKYSAFGIGAALSLSAPFQGDAGAVYSVAIMASVFVIEGFTKKNVWLGFPANFLYLLAYFMVLIDLNVDQAQYYSVPIAMLGILMHYLLRKADHQASALVTGVISQLILLSTTYLQMVIIGDSGYFFFLFFQSLVILYYGIVIRSRSMVFTPLFFIALSVFTVMLQIFEGFMTLFIIGCTGFILLLAGVAALFMRERVLETRKILSDKLNDWEA